MICRKCLKSTNGFLPSQRCMCSEKYRSGRSSNNSSESFYTTSNDSVFFTTTTIGSLSNEDRESAIYATGYWNGIAEGKKQYELYGAVWHDEHGYQFTATVGEKVLNDDKWIKLYRKVEK